MYSDDNLDATELEPYITSTNTEAQQEDIESQQSLSGLYRHSMQTLSDTDDSFFDAFDTTEPIVASHDGNIESQAEMEEVYALRERVAFLEEENASLKLQLDAYKRHPSKLEKLKY